MTPDHDGWIAAHLQARAAGMANDDFRLLIARHPEYAHLVAKRELRLARAMLTGVSNRSLLCEKPPVGWQPCSGALDPAGRQRAVSWLS